MRNSIDQPEFKHIFPKNVDFSTARLILNNCYGFYYVANSSYLWHPNSKKKTVDELQANIDYFTSDDGLKLYLNKTYGWIEQKGSTGRQRKRNVSNKDKIGKHLIFGNSWLKLSKHLYKVLKTEFGNTSKTQKNQVIEIDNIVKNDREILARTCSINNRTIDNIHISNNVEYRTSHQTSNESEEGNHKQKINETKIFDVHNYISSPIQPLKKSLKTKNTGNKLKKVTKQDLSRTNKTMNDSDSFKVTKVNFNSIAPHNIWEQHDSLSSKLKSCYDITFTNDFLCCNDDTTENMKKIQTFILKNININDIHSGTENKCKSSLLYICGRPGSGKVS